MRPMNRLLVTALLASLALGVTAGRACAAPPELTVQSEKQAHPRLADAIRKMEEALHDLEAAPDDFGGNKAAAIRDTHQAIHSLKRALYYRLRMDDAALDRAQ